MSDLLELAKSFNENSKKKAETIETEFQNDLKMLNDSFMTSLKQSEAIITQGTISLEDQQKQLTKTITQYQKSVSDLIQKYQDQIIQHQKQIAQMNQDHQTEITRQALDYQSEINQIIESHTLAIQNHLNQDLQDQQNQITQMISTHNQEIKNALQTRQHQAMTYIYNNAWIALGMFLVAALVMFCLGLMFAPKIR